MVGEQQWQAFCQHKAAITEESQRLKSFHLTADNALGQRLADIMKQSLTKDCNLLQILRRPDITYSTLMTIEGIGPGLTAKRAAEQVEIQTKYAGYIERQQVEIDKQQRQQATKLPDDIDYANIPSLSAEVVQKLNDVKPTSIGQAARISGVTPAAISLLLVHLKKRSYRQSA